MLCERSFAHTCETGAGRRSWLRGLVNVSERYVIHAAYNLGVILRKLFGGGHAAEPAGPGRGSLCGFFATLWALWQQFAACMTAGRQPNALPTPITTGAPQFATA